MKELEMQLSGDLNDRVIDTPLNESLTSKKNKHKCKIPKIGKSK